MIVKKTLQCEKSTDEMPLDEWKRKLNKRWWGLNSRNIYIKKYNVFVDTFSED